MPAFADLTSPTMPGPFYFAWVDPDEVTFDPFVHAREDEKVFSLQFEQNEGDFGTLSLTMRNPKMGLLGPCHKRHLFMAYGPAGSSPAEIKPLFRGRLVGVPSDLNKEVVTLQFTGRPSDFAAQKELLAYAKKELPFYDPVFISIDEQSNPDTVLESRSELWHIDRVTGEVTSTDIIVGEDGLAIFTAGEVPYDSVQLTLNETPLRRVKVTCNVGWTQAHTGVLTMMYHNQFDSFLADSVSKAWPTAAGNSLGGGWTTTFVQASSSIDNIPSDAFSTNITLNAPPAPIPADQTVIEPPPAPPVNTLGRPIPPNWIFILTDEQVHGHATATEATLQVSESGVIIPFVSIWLSMSVQYEAARNRKEQVTFTMQANTQPIVTEADDTEVMELSFNGNDLGADVGDGTVPIGSLTRGGYFTTARGQLSLQYLMLVARAHLLLRARAVQVQFDCPFDRAIDLSGRMNAQVQDPRVPGGVATGKIVSYGFSADGDSGDMHGNVTIACAIGYGGSISETAGTPSYVNDGYVNDGYQFQTNQLTVLPAGDVGYTVPGGPIPDDGLRFPLHNIPWISKPQFHPVFLGADDFPIVLDFFDKDHTTKAQTAISNILATKRCHLDFEIRSVTGEFNVGYDLTTSLLEVPKQIDLEVCD